MEPSLRLKIENCPQCGGGHPVPFFPATLVIDGEVYQAYGLCPMTGAWLFLSEFVKPDVEREDGGGSHAEDPR